MTETTTEKKYLTDIFLSEYSFIKNEMKNYIDLFHKQTNFLTLYISLITGFISISISVLNKNSEVAPFLLIHYDIPLFGMIYTYQLLGFFVYSILTLVGYYFLISTVSYIYVIEVLARRIAVIERDINSIVGKNIMVWEISISPKLIRGLVRKNLWMSPSYIRIIISIFLLLLIISMFVATSSIIMTNALSTIYVTITILLTIFFCIQVFLYHRVGVPHIIEVVNSECSIKNIESPN